MKNGLIVVTLAAFLLTWIDSPAHAHSDVQWRTDLDAATAESHKDGRPLLVVFR